MNPMRYVALALALCFSLAPLEAATSTSMHLVRVKSKVRKNKVKGRKAPKRKATHNRVN
jgi:hypothetical protein